MVGDDIRKRRGLGTLLYEYTIWGRGFEVVSEARAAGVLTERGPTRP